MPTKRRKLSPRRINEPVPAWALALLAGGDPPGEGDEARHAYLGWLYLRDEVPGLPAATSPEGEEIRARLSARPDGSSRW